MRAKLPYYLKALILFSRSTKLSVKGLFHSVMKSIVHAVASDMYWEAERILNGEAKTIRVWLQVYLPSVGPKNINCQKSGPFKCHFKHQVMSQNLSSKLDDT